MKKVRHLMKMALKVYKERGLRSLFFRIFIYFKDLIKHFYFVHCKYYKFNKRKKDILYISGTTGGSKFYRCKNQSEEMEKYGLKSVIVDQNSPDLPYLVDVFEVFIFQRVAFNKSINELINKIKKQRKLIIFEVDDLIFDKDFSKNISGFNYFSEEAKKRYSNGIGRELLEDDYVKKCIVSTEFLKEKIIEKYPNKDVFVSYNKLGKDQVKWADECLKQAEKIKAREETVIRIGYFSGSKSHDQDFETVADVLIRILEKNKNVILMVVGYLKLNDNFKRVKDQVKHFSFVPIEKLPYLIIRADINIAPLEIENPFCQAKSAIKYLEAGILKIPTVAAATDSFQRVIKNGETGFLAKNSQEWEESLLELIKNKNKRIEMGEKAHIDVLKNYTTLKEHADTRRLAEFIKREIEKQNSDRFLSYG